MFDIIIGRYIGNVTNPETDGLFEMAIKQNSLVPRLFIQDTIMELFAVCRRNKEYVILIGQPGRA